MKIWSYITFIIVLIIQAGCVGESGRPSLPQTIAQRDGADVDDLELCTEFYDVSDFTCRDECRIPLTHLASEQEVVEAQILIQQQFIDDEEFVEEALANINASQGLCVAGSGVLRPSEAIFLDGNYCACRNRLPDIVNQCEAICQDRTDLDPNQATLFGTVRLGLEVQANPQLNNLHDWCNVELIGSDLVSPGCSLEVNDGTSTTLLPIAISPGSNSFQVNIEQLAIGTTYLATIVESQSTGNARTETFNLRRRAPDAPNPNLSPLPIIAVNQYTCISRAAQVAQNGATTFIDFARSHFYYPEGRNPPALPPGIRTTICHDPDFNNSDDDSVLFPRLELIPGHFAVWNESDSRFVDADQNGSADINTEIEQRLLADTGSSVQGGINLFNLFNFPNMPTIASLPNQVASPNVGFFLQSFIEDGTGRGFCPGNTEYNSNDPLFRILGDIIQIETEGIYLAQGEPLVQDNGAVVQDLIIVRETLLDAISFFVQGTSRLRPNDLQASTQTIHFFWPPNPSFPTIQGPDQELYTVRAPEEIGATASMGLRTTVRPPDQRFGCVPTSGPLRP